MENNLNPAGINEKQKMPEEVGSQQEKAGTSSIYSLERLKQFSALSDEQIKYYSEHNVWSPIRLKWGELIRSVKDKDVPATLELDELTRIKKGDNKTYQLKAHPLLPRVDKDNQDSRRTAMKFLDNVTNVVGNEKYLIEKRLRLDAHDPNSPVMSKIFSDGHLPYGHGSQMFWFTGVGIDFDVIDKGVSDQSFSVNFLKYASYFIGSAGADPVMSKIDTGRLSFPEFELKYLSAVENYIKVAPRFLTLIARNPEWNIQELDAYIKAKDIPNIDEVFGQLKDSDSIGHALELLAVVRKREYTEEERQDILKIIQVWADVYAAMSEYFEERVTYADEKVNVD